MPRPGAVIEVDRNTPPVLFHYGEGIRLEKMPLGARIVYPPDPLEPIAHPERAIKRALAAPDVRQLVMEEVIDMAAEAGIDDLHIIAALGLHRRMTDDELRHIVGDRIFATFHPDRLYQHDGEDEENNVYIGKTSAGEEVTVNRRAAESDLVIYVNLTLVPMDGGHKSMSTGLATYRGIRAHHNVKTLLGSRSYMNPPDSALHHSCIRQGHLIEDTVR